MQPSDPTAAAEVEALGAAFGLSNDATRTRFSHLFLNVVDNPAARQRPPNVDALRWRQAIYRAGGRELGSCHSVIHQGVPGLCLK